MGLVAPSCGGILVPQAGIKPTFDQIPHTARQTLTFNAHSEGDFLITLPKIMFLSPFILYHMTLYFIPYVPLGMESLCPPKIHVLKS